MRFAGGESWRLAEDVERLPHVALFLRDVLRLPVEGGPLVPPPLALTVPDLSDRWADPDGAAAGWTRWWRAIVAEADLTSQVRDALDPPYWSSLDGLPALRDAVVAVSDEALRFSSRVREDVLSDDGPPRPALPWQMVRDAAEDVAADGVPMDELDVSVGVLRVRGPWWRIVRPGRLLCSADLAQDADTAREALRAAFRSSVA
ncbi:hypothetical protein [Actinomadura rupiterrae]|uniref:hypothetical protein n=1 Tax=Actinomadura rupiterrae TaxID=559627 RepID=UPI0020A3E7CF|nr:hypothetical protein [Actinomadura rupiterrae]MCP2335838.1 hypothetical protein [Actinomadura rupiterrae]